MKKYLHCIPEAEVVSKNGSFYILYKGTLLEYSKIVECFCNENESWVNDYALQLNIDQEAAARELMYYNPDDTRELLDKMINRTSE